MTMDPANLGVTVTAAGVALRLLPQRAIWLEDQQALVIADPHFGKAASYRALGQPVPRGTTLETLTRLDALLALWPARRLIVLGDFLHSRAGRAPPTLAAMMEWRQRHAALHCLLVRGNHDDRAGDPPAEMDIHIVDEPYRLGSLDCLHHPPATDQVEQGRYALAGHLHPSVVLLGRAHERLRLPCFHFGPTHAVLPAFGAFTGTWQVRPHPADQVYVVADDHVLLVPSGQI
jgi:DNA ligase-associated metallophosphoesterase